MFIMRHSEFEKTMTSMRGSEKARQIFSEGGVIYFRVDRIHEGFDVEGTVRDGRKTYDCFLIINDQGEIIKSGCGCFFNRFFSACEHVGALILKVRQFNIPSFPFEYQSPTDDRLRLQEQRERQREEYMLKQLEHRRELRESITRDLATLIQQDTYQIFQSAQIMQPALFAVYTGNEGFRFKIGETRTYYIKNLTPLSITCIAMI